MEGGHQVLPLGLVLVALGQEHADAQDLANAISKELRFDKLVALGGQDLVERFGTGQEEAFAVEEVKIADEAIVGDLIRPASWRHAGWLLDQRGPLTVDQGAARNGGKMAERTDEVRIDEDVVDKGHGPQEQEDEGGSP
jgi:hypothetical protein